MLPESRSPGPLSPTWPCWACSGFARDQEGECRVPDQVERDDEGRHQQRRSRRRVAAGEKLREQGDEEHGELWVCKRGHHPIAKRSTAHGTLGAALHARFHDRSARIARAQGTSTSTTAPDAGGRNPLMPRPRRGPLRSLRLRGRTPEEHARRVAEGRQEGGATPAARACCADRARRRRAQGERDDHRETGKEEPTNAPLIGQANRTPTDHASRRVGALNSLARRSRPCGSGVSQGRGWCFARLGRRRGRSAPVGRASSFPS